MEGSGGWTVAVGMRVRERRGEGEGEERREGRGQTDVRKGEVVMEGAKEVMKAEAIGVICWVWRGQRKSAGRARRCGGKGGGEGGTGSADRGDAGDGR